MRMSGKRALVTGAASGIGKAVVSAFVQEGAEVIAADMAYVESRPPDGAAALELHLDVADPAAWEGLLERTGPAGCAGGVCQHLGGALYR